MAKFCKTGTDIILKQRLEVSENKDIDFVVLEKTPDDLLLDFITSDDFERRFLDKTYTKYASEKTIDIFDKIGEIDSYMTYASSESESVQFNTIKEPNLKSKFVYNFYTTTEESLRQESAEFDFIEHKQNIISERAIPNVGKLPRYVELRWNPLTIENELSLPNFVLKQSELKNAKKLYNDLRGSFVLQLPPALKDPNIIFDNINNEEVFKNTFQLLTTPGDEPYGFNVKEDQNKNFLKISMTADGLSTLFADVAQQRYPNEEIAALGNVLKDSEIKNGEQKHIQSAKLLAGVDYIGYTIEKERLEKDGDNPARWKKINKYCILGALNNIFKDPNVAYGQLYRYRIRSIIKATIPTKSEKIEYYEKIPLENVNRIGLTRTVTGLIYDFIGVDIRSLALTPREREEKEYYALPPEERRKRVPPGHGPARYGSGRTQSHPPTYSLGRFVKNEANKQHVRLRDVIQAYNDKMDELNEERAKKENNYISYYFESDPNRVWQYVSTRDTEPPTPPRDITVVPNSVQKKIRVSWNIPVLSQGDLSFIRIYRRIIDARTNKEESDWDIIHTIDYGKIHKVEKESFSRRVLSGEFDHLFPNAQEKFAAEGITLERLTKLDYTNFFDDEREGENTPLGEHKMYIYALESEDMHGLRSFLSMQIGARLNPNFPRERQELPLKFIAGPGLRLDEREPKHGTYKSVPDVYHTNRFLTIKPAKTFQEKEKDFIIKIKSLDTFETKELKITIKNEKQR